MMKRSLDILLSALSLVILSPLLILASVAIKLSSPGPILFRQQRMGRYGVPFKILKLRSMIVTDGRGLTITAKNDPRITAVGKWLRSSKIDELPQLWNVLSGDMSLVGPRPEVAEHICQDPAIAAQILSVRPGITDRASIQHINEEEILAASSDPLRVYREVLLPKKYQLQTEYVQRQSTGEDLKILFDTLAALFRRRSRP